MLPIFPTSPLPAALDREPFWGNNVTQFDSGLYQGSTPYLKPLYRYNMSFQNIPRSKQSSLHAFYNARKGKMSPFLMQDPYDYSATGGVVVATGTNVSSFLLANSDGWTLFPKSGSILLTSNLSGNLTQGSHWVMNGDNGIIVASMRPTSTDYWFIKSAEYYRKVVFSNFAENSSIWNQFSAQISIMEIALP